MKCVSEKKIETFFFFFISLFFFLFKDYDDGSDTMVTVTVVVCSDKGSLSFYYDFGRCS